MINETLYKILSDLFHNSYELDRYYARYREIFNDPDISDQNIIEILNFLSRKNYIDTAQLVCNHFVCSTDAGREETIKYRNEVILSMDTYEECKKANLIAKEANKLSHDANRTSLEANELSKHSNKISTIALIFSAIAIMGVIVDLLLRIFFKI